MNQPLTPDEKRAVAIERAITLSMMLSNMAHDDRASANQRNEAGEALRLIDDAIDILCNGFVESP